MDTILALREKRKNLWDAAKAFLDMARDENGMVSAEDAARYDKMEEDVVNLGKEIDRLERQQQLDAQLAQPTSSPITEQPGAGTQVPEKKGRASNAYQKAFWDSIRHKNFIDVQNALSVGTDADGGYLVPDEFEHQLIDKLQEENFFRSLATVIHTSGDRKIPVVTGHGEASWMEENGLYPDSQDTFGQQSIGAYKLGTAIRVSEELLNDSVFDLESYIAGSSACTATSTAVSSASTAVSAALPCTVFTETDAPTSTVHKPIASNLFLHILIPVSPICIPAESPGKVVKTDNRVGHNQQPANTR